MQLSLINYFLLASLLSICWQSCSPVRSFGPFVGKESVTISEKYIQTPFNEDYDAFLFNCKISYGNKFEQSGLMALKQLNPDDYRAIFMTKFGLTLFDFEFGKKGFVVHKSFEAMDNKLLLKIIEADMESVLCRNMYGTEGVLLKNKNTASNNYILKTKMNKKRHYFVCNESQQTDMIFRQHSVVIDFVRDSSNFLQEISIKHKPMPLQLNMTLIKK